MTITSQQVNEAVCPYSTSLPNGPAAPQKAKTLQKTTQV